MKKFNTPAEVAAEVLRLIAECKAAGTELTVDDVMAIDSIVRNAIV